MYKFCCNCNSKGQCSMFGANKTATATGGTLQLRALDWDVDGKAMFLCVTVHMGGCVCVKKSR